MSANSIDIDIAKMLEIKAKITEAIYPSRHYMDFITHHFPHRNNKTDKVIIRAMWSFRRVDKTILSELEQLPELIKNS